MDNKQQEQGLIGHIHKHNVNTYLKAFVVVILTLVISWKLLWTNITLSELKTTDILFLIIAIFSIGLSVAFYFKATDTSNDFYDNSFKFTKEVSVILGRIEAGFGERLKHLDEGYSTISQKFDGLPYGISKEQAEKKIEKEEEAIEKNENERLSMIEELINKTNMQAIEKEEFLHKLENKENELSKMKRRIFDLSKQLESSEETDQKVSLISNHILSYIMRRGNITPEDISNSSNIKLMELFSNLDFEISDSFFRDFTELGFYEPKTKRLTRRGINLLKKIAIDEQKRISFVS